jgi:hypothetical protein
MDMIPLYRFDTVIENGYTVIVPSFEWIDNYYINI